jgi:hypothetical protein
LYKREHHQRIASILEQLNSALLKEHHCYFGGGTAIALRQNEYRESVDIDFLVSDINSYRELRQLLTSSDGIHAISNKDSHLILAREIRADQYGIRTFIESGNKKIKFEIVLEGRISFDTPDPNDMIGNIATLSRLDLMASKLLANSDRWNDRVVYSRDMIDLVMLEPSKEELKKALQKAHLAYGDSIHTDLHKAVGALLSSDARLKECMDMLRIELPKALLRQKLEDLRTDHLAILNQQADKKIQQAGNSQAEKFIDQKLKDIDYILAFLKDK